MVERSHLQFVRREHADSPLSSEEDELAAWGDTAEISAAVAAPVQTPLVERFDLDAVAADGNVRSTDGAQVLNDEQQAAVVRRLLLGEVTAEEACAAHRVTREQLTQWVRRHRRAVRRNIEEQIGSALSAQGLEKEDFVLSGNLESMSLSDLLETIQLGRKNAHVRVESGSEVGELWFADGDVIDARIGSLVGSPAVYRLLELTEGKLQAEFCSTERERTILASTETLLIEYARRADERKMLRDQIGDLQRVYVASPAAAAASLEPRQRDVLKAFDGSRTVEKVLASSGRPELDSLTVIMELLKQKLLVPASSLPAANDGSEPEQPALNRAAQPGYASLFPSAGPATLPSASQAEAPSAPPSSQAVSSQVISSRLFSARGGASMTVPPVAPSVALLQTMPALARRSAPFVLGAGALVLAFAVGLWSARSPAQRPQPEPAARPSEASLTEALCGPGMALFTPPSGSAERPFCLAQRSVTTAEYQACVDAQHCAPPEADAPPAPGDGKARCNAGQPGREQLPINCVTQRQAEQYCDWRGQRLPLPAEWELAWQASRSSSARASVSFQAAGLETPLGELSEWTKERTARPGTEAAQPSAATADTQPSAAAAADGVALDEAQPSARAAPGAAPEPAEAAGEAAPDVRDRVETIEHEPTPASFAVLRAPPPSSAQPDARPKRLYTSATAQGRSIGFRCAISLETTR